MTAAGIIAQINRAVFHAELNFPALDERLEHFDKEIAATAEAAIRWEKIGPEGQVEIRDRLAAARRSTKESGDLFDGSDL